MLIASFLYLFFKFVAGASFEVTVCVPTFTCAAITWFVSIVRRAENEAMLNRFYCILNTPIGQEAALVQAGINLPAMSDGHTDVPNTLHTIDGEKIDGEKIDGEKIDGEKIDGEKIARLYDRYAQHKICGPTSSIEIRKEPGLGWYYRGFVIIRLGCFVLILVTVALSWFMTGLG
jgi:hypothetical protein